MGPSFGAALCRFIGWSWQGFCLYGYSAVVRSLSPQAHPCSSDLAAAHLSAIRASLPTARNNQARQKSLNRVADNSVCRTVCCMLLWPR